MRNLINDNHPKWRLFGPQNPMDTNYHLVNRNSGTVRLIDIHDIYEGEPGDNEGEPWLPWEVLRGLSDIPRIKSFVWRKVAH